MANLSPAFVASVDITPHSPHPLSGYSGGTRWSTGVAQRLEANVLVLEASDGPIYLVAVDSLYGGDLGRRISEGLGCPDDRVLVAGSHTHFAPGVDPDLATLGAPSLEYMNWVASQVVEAIWQADHVENGKIGYGEAAATGLFMNRRLPVFGRRLTRAFGGPVRMAPYPKGRVDENVRAVALCESDRLVAVVWGASCHPVCTPDPSRVSSAFPGAVREMIRDSVGDPALPVLFLQGFSGDVRPASVAQTRPRSLWGLVRSMGNHGRTFAPQNRVEYDEWCSGLGKVALTALITARRETQEMNVSYDSVRIQPDGWQRAVCGTRVGISDDVQVVAINAEVMSSRVDSLRHIAQHVIPVGCAGGVIGYWPTDQMVREGGYEARHSRQHFPSLEWEGGADPLWDQLIESLCGSTTPEAGEPAVPEGAEPE